MSVASSTGCGTRASRICTKGQMSAMCSKKCRSSPTCGSRGTPRQGGREPPWGRGASTTPPCGSTRTSLPALSFLRPCEEWCLNSDRAIAFALRSWRRNERRRRSLRLRALPVPPPSPTRAAITRKPPVRVEHKKGSPETRKTRVLCTVVVVVVVRTLCMPCVSDHT